MGKIKTCCNCKNHEIYWDDYGCYGCACHAENGLELHKKYCKSDEVNFHDCPKFKLKNDYIEY